MKTIDWGKVTFIESKDESFVNLRTCPICKYSLYEVMLTISNFQFFIDKTDAATQIDYRVVQCSKCKALFTNPAYSSKGFMKLFKLAGLSYGHNNPQRIDLIIEDLIKHNCLKDSSVVLDFGCGSGDLLGKMPRNLKRIGLDIDAFSISNAKKKYGTTEIEFIRTDFSNFSAYNRSSCPDTITMFHVLEHLVNPLEVLIFLRSISKQSTTLVIEVPVLENSATNDINGFFSVQHLTHFSETSLSNLLQQSGWTIIKKTYQKDYRGYRLYARPMSPILNLNLNSEDRKLTYKYMASWYKSLQVLNNRIKSKLDMNNIRDKIVIWGAGLHTEFLYHFTDVFTKFDHYEFVIIDSDTQKINHTWRGLNIYHSSLLSTFDWNNSFLVLSSYGSQPIMFRHAIEGGVPIEAIVALYDSVQSY
jgi:2-polyprenyl-3-methyl-5-hydroxy-6-metoxy-1,4-benzoquinol methylase